MYDFVNQINVLKISLKSARFSATFLKKPCKSTILGRDYQI
jgi:hypothetical protein